jgi:mycothiol synthase
VEAEMRYGSIQNVGVLPNFRGRGLGTALVRQALLSFAELGLEKAYLEVTAENAGAYRLYERLGFVPVHTARRPTLQALAPT